MIHSISTVESNVLKQQKFNSDLQVRWKLQRFHKSHSKDIHMSRETTATKIYLTALVSLTNSYNQTHIQDSIFWLLRPTWLKFCTKDIFWYRHHWTVAAGSTAAQVLAQHTAHTGTAQPHLGWEQHPGLKQELPVHQIQRRGGDKSCCPCSCAKATVGQFLIRLKLFRINWNNPEEW